MFISQGIRESAPKKKKFLKINQGINLVHVFFRKLISIIYWLFTMDESLIKKTAGLSLDDEPVIVEYPTPRTVSTTKKVKSAKTKKEKTKRKKEKKEREVEVEVEETEYKRSEFQGVALDPTLVGKILDRIETAVQRLAKKNQVEIEIKFGKMMGRNSEARLALGGKPHPRIIHKLAFGHFDSDIGLHHFRKVCKSIEESQGPDPTFVDSRRKDTYHATKTQMFVNSKNLKDSTEICYKKRILGDFYIYNPTGEFDFKFLITERIIKNEEESERIKTYRRLFTRLKRRRNWYETSTGNVLSTSIIKLDPAVRNHRYEFEMRVDSQPIVLSALHGLGDGFYQDFHSKLLGVLYTADEINESL